MQDNQLQTEQPVADATNAASGKTGWPAMEAWDKTWKWHHIPMWAKKKIRLNAIKAGTWVPNFDDAYAKISYDGFFDHWGSVQRGDVRALITQPYGNHDAKAAQWAEEMDCLLESFRSGPWHPNTWCYIFTPKHKVEPRKRPHKNAKFSSYGYRIFRKSQQRKQANPAMVQLPASSDSMVDGEAGGRGGSRATSA